MKNYSIQFSLKQIFLNNYISGLIFGFAVILLFSQNLHAQQFGSAQNIGKVIVKNPAVFVVRNGESLSVSGFGRILKKGDTVITQRDGKAHIILNNGSELFLAPSAKLTISEQLIGKSNKGIKQFILSIYGKIRLQIKKRKIKQVTVKTKTAVIAVKGTDFIVSYENEITMVGTLEGLVNLTSRVNQQHIDIPPGKMSSVSPDGDVMSLSEIAGEMLRGVEFAGEQMKESDISGEKIKD